ncbi:hypothetical protein V6N13_020513 [Hibiscus sabdariffa]|uniref:Uncharacterized protein n=1 Tax=Hibiscus sabdariffa TaxID=183260 RepID=A0ABR2EU48_9ROSI
MLHPAAPSTPTAAGHPCVAPLCHDRLPYANLNHLPDRASEQPPCQVDCCNTMLLHSWELTPASLHTKDAKGQSLQLLPRPPMLHTAHSPTPAHPRTDPSPLIHNLHFSSPFTHSPFIPSQNHTTIIPYL